MHIKLGYEVNTGKEISIPLHHLAVTGQTQLSGKTTALEALISRSNLRAVAFVTKRFERSFEGEGANEIPPYFRERADWQFVSAVLEATMRERLKFERSWIMRVSKQAKTLADVQRNVRTELEKAKRELDRSVYMCLDAYLDIVVPQLAKLPYVSKVELKPGINVMDLRGYSTEVQALIIRSVIEWVHDKETDTIVIVPEAPKFIPQQRGSPVKLAAETFIRECAAGRNYLWLDSQDIAGFDTSIRRHVGVWLFGVQREANELKRAIAHLDVVNPKPKPQDILTLDVGQFYVSFGRELHKVYVQPKWMDCATARRVAMGKVDAVMMPTVMRPPWQGVLARADSPTIENILQKIDEEDDVYKEKFEEEQERANVERKRADDLQQRVHELESQVHLVVNAVAGAPDGKVDFNPMDHNRDFAMVALEAGMVPNPALTVKPFFEQIPDPPYNVEAFASLVFARLQKPPYLLKVVSEEQGIDVVIERKTVKLDGASILGRLAQLVVDGFFKLPTNPARAHGEMQRRGWHHDKRTVYREVDKLNEMGFLIKDKDGFVAVPEMKINIVRA